MGRVIIGMDPHKRSATIEIINDREQVLAQGRFNTDTAGYQAMLKLGRGHKDRIWAVEGCNGVGRHIAQRLIADGETVVDVPSKLSARARVFATGQGRKTDPVDAHSVAVVAVRTKGLRRVVADDTAAALRLLVDRRDALGRARTELVSRLHAPVRSVRVAFALDGRGARHAHLVSVLAIPAMLVPSGRWADIHFAQGAVCGSGSCRCRRRPYAASVRLACG